MTNKDSKEAEMNLLPCPHCGSEVSFGYGQGYIFVSCPECLAGNSLAMDNFKGQKDDAIEHWNTRSESKLIVSRLTAERDLWKERFEDHFKTQREAIKHPL